MTAGAPVIGVLALQGDFREHRSALDRLGARTALVRSASELAAVDALVIPGGESTAMSKLAVRLGMIAPLRQAVEEGMPMYGSCAGMILMATKVLDGRPDQQSLAALDITVRRNAFGRQVDSFEEDLNFRGIAGPPIRAVFIRAPWVESAEPEVQVLASVGAEASTGRIVAVRQGDRLATSFHPELTGDFRVHEYFIEMVRASQYRCDRDETTEAT